MFKFLKSDPVKKAKKHIDKALIEIEEGYPELKKGIPIMLVWNTRRQLVNS
jgi:hypothetical protein